MIEINGSLGEGGGQVLRSALTLSLLTQQPVRLTNIRGRRPKPGLQPQHLTAVKAAAEISSATVTGAALDSQELTFAPADVRAGDYRFDIGTAGSTSLVLQTIYLPLALGPDLSGLGDPKGLGSEITLIGGTHVPWSPSFHYLDLQWRPYVERLGLRIGLELELAGFYPQGNGQARARIERVERIGGMHLTERGALKGIQGISAVANLDKSIAERQRAQAMRRLQGRHNRIEIELLDLPSRVKGTFLLLLAEFKHGSACYVGLGAPGKRAEQVADEACLWLERFLATNGALDEYLADQLLLPLAFAEGPSELRTAKVTPHLLTNAEIIRAFGAAEIEIAGETG
ncbi:MAG: RNA 3'-terminal phosphate cyclase, partial [Chloroflexi bacterium]|nr:RNA 3'-terminal phosphate cyclase [Chloroflexota bacterium]